MTNLAENVVSPIEAPPAFPFIYRNSAIESSFAFQRKEGWRTTALISDYDNSYFRKGKENITRRLGQITEKNHIPTIIVSGRDKTSLLESVRQNGFALPEVVVGAVGTEIWVLTTDENGKQTYVRDENYEELLATSGFNRKSCVEQTKAFCIDKKNEEYSFTFQSPELEEAFLEGNTHEVQPYKVSYFMTANDTSRSQMEARMREQFPSYEIVISEAGDPVSGDGKKRFNVDFVPKISRNGKELGGGKHGAVNYLSDVLGIDRGFKVGDSGNDVGMLLNAEIGHMVEVGGSKEELLSRIAQWFPEGSQPIGDTQFRRVRRPGEKDQKAYVENTDLKGPESIVRAAIQRIEVALKFETNETYRKTMQNLVKELRSVMEIPVLVFGYGPVLDKNTRMKAEMGKPEPGNEAPSIWMQDSIEAARILAEKDPSHSTRFFIMGGKTGGSDYASESEVTKRHLVEAGIPAGSIEEDAKSKVTFENIVNYINNASDGPVDIIASSHHVNRVVLYLTLFGVPIRNIYVSQEVVRQEAHAQVMQGASDEARKSQEILNRLERQLDVNDKTFYLGKAGPKGDFKQFPGQKGLERELYVDKLKTDNLWMRETLEMPQQYLSYLGNIRDDKRLKQGIEVATYIYGEAFLQKKFKISLTDDVNSIRDKLKQIAWPPPEYHETPDVNGITQRDKVIMSWIADMEGSDWPEHIQERRKRAEEVTKKLAQGQPILQ